MKKGIIFGAVGLVTGAVAAVAVYACRKCLSPVGKRGKSFYYDFESSGAKENSVEENSENTEETARESSPQVNMPDRDGGM